jgi:sterol desaturase/sphingolipid hydroxylase (fatty acid hydroxylase superfamily)
MSDRDAHGPLFWWPTNHILHPNVQVPTLMCSTELRLGLQLFEKATLLLWLIIITLLLVNVIVSNTYALVWISVDDEIRSGLNIPSHSFARACKIHRCCKSDSYNLHTPRGWHAPVPSEIRKA